LWYINGQTYLVLWRVQAKQFKNVEDVGVLDEPGARLLEFVEGLDAVGIVWKKCFKQT
jgi:hypothetical protein